VSRPRSFGNSVWLFAAASLCVLAIVQTAWLSDDAYITLRTIDNVWNGYGLRWNVVERVQSYTHPLWMLVLAGAYGVTREAFYTTVAMSLACVLLMIALVIRRLPPASAALAIVLLTSSRALVEFSTSGLENPLSHLLLIAFWLVAMDAGKESAPRRLTWLGALAGLCCLNRLDLALLVGPALIVRVWQLRLRQQQATRTRTVAIGSLPLLWAALPLLAWHAFVLIYYGTLLPNTVLAKLDTGIPTAALAEQGLRYLQESWTTDPITLTVIAAACVWGLGKRSAVSIGLVCGLVLYFAYVVLVGGDFMSGRFLTAPFVCAAVFIARGAGRLLEDRPFALASVSALIIVMAVALTTPRSPWRVWAAAPVEGEPFADFHGIVDEQRIYYPYTGLLAGVHGHRPADHSWARTGTSWRSLPRVAVYEAVGLLGFHAGPAVHIIDPMGLTDPLIARLPARPQWRIGHFKREIPAGYVQGMDECLHRIFPHGSVAPTTHTCLDWPAETNTIADPTLSRRYDLIRLVTQGPLFSTDRWRAIVRLNTGW
jgi:arabinofuranosyltransferase